MSDNNQLDSNAVNDVLDDISDGLKHTGSEQLLKLLEDNVSDDNNLVDSIVQLIINKVNDIQDTEKDVNYQIIKVLNKVGKLSQKLKLYDEMTKELTSKDLDTYCQMLNESYKYHDKILYIEEN